MGLLIGAAAFQGSKCKKGPHLSDSYWQNHPGWVLSVWFWELQLILSLFGKILIKKKRDGMEGGGWLCCPSMFDCIYSGICFAYCWSRFLGIVIKASLCFLGPDNQPCLLEGLVCPRREIKKKKNPKSVMSVLSRFYKMTSLLCRILFCSCYLARFMLPWQI